MNTSSKMKILILGGSGMLGSSVFRCFHASKSFETTATVRNPAVLTFFSPDETPRMRVNVDVLDSDVLISLMDTIRPDVVINCVGLIKQLPSSNDPLVALPINALFPHRLARICALGGARLIHVSTDCVFSGSKGNYSESDLPDATDLYGRSKLLGELVDYDNAVTLRTSIIGRELSTSHSLVDWFLEQRGTVQGFSRAIFSGLPACELAAVMRDVVLPRTTLKGLYHVSAAPISKLELLRLIADQYGLGTELVPNDDIKIDRSLDSSRFAAETGYIAPAWPELVRRMHDADPRRSS